MVQQAEVTQKALRIKLKEGESVNEHIKAMTEIFEELANIGNAVAEEDQVIHLLASLPDLYNILSNW